MSSDNRSNEPATNHGRRIFCQVAIGGMTVGAAGMVGYPVATFLGLPRSLEPEKSMEMPTDSLAEGVAAWGEHSGRQIVVIKVDGQVRAFDGACPHLGCIVMWDGASASFKCPCHGAAFNSSGAPIAGPVNAPLRPVEFVIKDGVLKVS